MVRKKEILVAVAGLTPQVITETLYYLTQIKKPHSKIDEIYVLTTADGKIEIEKRLLGKRGKFLDFCREYLINPHFIKFNEDSIILLKDSKGKPLQDIRTEDDNKSVANQINDFIMDKTNDPEVILHCSVAGGRKTMSVYLAYALMLFGRPWDTLSHVLVHEKLESNKEFYFPKKYSRHKSKVELAEIPYLRLRDKISNRIESDKVSYNEIITSAQVEIDKLPARYAIEVNLKKRCLLIDNLEIRFSPKLLAIYAHFAERRRAFQSEESFQTLKGKDSIMYRLDEIKDFILKIQPNAELVKYSFSRDNFLQDISKINRKIKNALGNQTLASKYQISPEEHRRTYGATRYGLHIEKSKVKPVVFS